jgi:hypothetical protein
MKKMGELQRKIKLPALAAVLSLLGGWCAIFSTL